MFRPACAIVFSITVFQSNVSGRDLSHEVDVDEVTYVINEYCNLPEPLVCEETRHLRHQSPLRLYNLIYGYAIVRLFMLRCAY